MGVPEELIQTYSDRVFDLQKTHWSARLFPDIAEVFTTLAKQNTLVVVTASQTEAVTCV